MPERHNVCRNSGMHTGHVSTPCVGCVTKPTVRDCSRHRGPKTAHRKKYLPSCDATLADWAVASVRPTRKTAVGIQMKGSARTPKCMPCSCQSHDRCQQATALLHPTVTHEMGVHLSTCAACVLLCTRQKLAMPHAGHALLVRQRSSM